MSKNYNFIGIDEGKQNLFRGDTNSGNIQWIKPLTEFPNARALERIDEHTILLGHEKGYCIVDINHGDIIHNCSKWEEVSSAHRCSNGTILITGQDLNGEKGVCVLTLDNDDEVVHTAVQHGDYVRLMSIMGDKYLLSTNDHITICDKELNTLQTLSAEGFLHAWQSRVLEDNTVLVSAGYGAFMVKFSDNGEILSTFGRADQLPKEINPFFYAAFDIDEDSNILVANWQGHGPDNGMKGRQLVLFDPKGNYLDSWTFSKDVSSFQGLLLL